MRAHEVLLATLLALSSAFSLAVILWMRRQTRHSQEATVSQESCGEREEEDKG